MKRLLCLLLVCLLVLSGCASAPEPELSEMLGTLEGSTYTSPFGFTVDLTGMKVHSNEELAALNQLDGGFSEEGLMELMENGIAVGVLSAVPAGGSSLVLSLELCSALPETVRSAEDGAAYALSTIPGKLEDAGYTDIQVRSISVILDDGEHPAILCSARITEDYSYHLLQIYFQEGDWMGGLSLCSLESEEALRDLLTRVTSTN